MSAVDVTLLVVAAVSALVAGLFSSADAALSSFSKARAEEIASEGRSGSARLLVIVEDPPRYLNTALFLRMLTEIAAIVLVTVVMLDLMVPGGSESGPQADGDRWWAILASIAIMLVVSFVVIGVAPRTLGRQHFNQVALAGAGAVRLLGRIFNPLAALLTLLGNAITPGRGRSRHCRGTKPPLPPQGTAATRTTWPSPW